MDVKSLYTNIPNNEGISAVRSYLEQSTIKHLLPVIISFLGLILTLNNFIFNDINFLQTNGASMGTKCAPTYANLFMGKFEEMYILPKLIGKSILYLRYIDDIFLIWKGSEEELKHFIDYINQVHSKIKFDIQYSYKEINFLDTKVQITNNGQLQTTLYKKPTDRKSFLHKKSYHPPSTKQSIPYSQALRLSRICSNDTEYMKQLECLKVKFIERGYQEKDVIEQFNKATAIQRKETLIYKEKEASNRLIFSTTYHRHLPNITQCLKDNWNLLHINEDISSKFMVKPEKQEKR